MNVKVRKIEVDAQTADLLEARATALGMSVAALIAELAGNETILPPDLAELRAKGEGPWSPEALEEDERRLAEFEQHPDGRALGRGPGLDAELGQAERTPEPQAS